MTTSTSKYFTNCRSEEFVCRKGESLTDAGKKCEKNRHDQFFDISELKRRLPIKYAGDESLIKQADNMAFLTVCLIIEADEKSLRYGSGFVQRVRQGRGARCPDKTCQHKGPSHSWGVFTVTTVHHVVQSQQEAEKVQVFPFFAPKTVIEPSNSESKLSDTESKPSDTESKPLDTESKPSDTDSKPSDTDSNPSDTKSKYSDTESKPSYTESKPSDSASSEWENESLLGYKLLESDKEGGRFDWCAVECVTHNMKLVDDFQKAINDLEELQKLTFNKYKSTNEKLVIMIGHPHGGPKKVSYGYWNSKPNVKDIRSTQNWCQYRHSAPSCPGNSGSPVLILGQPLCGYGYWFGHPHNHSAWEEEANETVTSIGADNVVDNNSD